MRTVLAVDDDASVLAALSRSIGRQRTVITTSDPDAAIQAARTQHPDVAIVDLRLGRVSGLDLTRRLKFESPATIVVVVSGYLSVETTVMAVRAGADFVMPKPVTAKTILWRIAQEEAERPDWTDTPTLADAETEHIVRVLADCEGNISEAARRLGIHRSSLQRRLRKITP